MFPHGVGRMASRSAGGTQTSGVRFWNFTASQPARAAASTSLRAMSRSPLWLIPISAATYVGCPSPTRRSPIRTVRAMRPPFVSVAQGCSRAAEIWQRGEASTKLIEMRAEDARALVTGGAGFIGSHLVERLVDLGARVTVVDDLSTGRLENLRGV